jgi:hypothetical protein
MARRLLDDLGLGDPQGQPAPDSRQPQFTAEIVTREGAAR